MTLLRRAVAPIDAWVIATQTAIYPYPRARKLAAIASWVNANSAALGLRAETSAGWASTDRKIPGTRLRREGKGRHGTVIRVYRTQGGERDGLGLVRPLFSHNSAETYRHNFEVERKLADWIAELPAATRRRLTVPA